MHEAAQLYRELLPLCPEGTYLSIAAGKNGVDYMIGGCNEFLEDASNEAVSRCPEGHADCGTCLHNLAFSLTSRFRHQGRPNDLDEAISLHEEVLHLCPVGRKYCDCSLNSVGLTLIIRFNQRGDIDGITRAISLHHEALALHPPGHSHRAITLNTLAVALKTKYDKSHVSEDLNETINLNRECLRSKQLDYPQRRNLFNLSSALCAHFMETQKNEDIKEAITLCQQSLAALPPLHLDRYFSYLWLQEAYLARYQILRGPADLSLAIQNFRLASGHPTQGFPEHIKTTYNWTIDAEQLGDVSALEAYSMCFDLLDGHLATRSSTISQREAAAAFYYTRSLSVDAASCAICHVNLQWAVELVEQGHGQQWSLAYQLRTPVEDLESTNPKLACNYLELSKRVSNAAQSSATITDRAAADLEAVEYRRLTRQWEAAVARICGLLVFSRFLLPPAYEDLQAAARQGPVIILIASQYSCSTIIILTSGDPRHGNMKSRTDLIVLLRIIWDQIMLPIVDVLEHILKLQHLSRIWLCPTAAFTSIPLHAAHPFQTKADHSGKEPCLEDLYICSYTPTLSALIRSRWLMKKCRVLPSFVAIRQGQLGAGKGKALLAVDSKLELVHKLVPAMVNCTTISGNEATRAGALEALQQNTCVHLTCHGKQDPEQPYDSHFVMRDEHLTLLNIMEKHIPQAEFAFLSACHTAVGDEETPDKVIHLAAGLQFSGFKSIIGTLWEVDDSVAKHIVEAFYGYMIGDLQKGGVMDCTRAAWALNCAMHAVKTKVPLEQRTVFVHIGTQIVVGVRLVKPTCAFKLHPFCLIEPRLTTTDVINALMIQNVRILVKCSAPPRLALKPTSR
ncbi:CHAT domain-containing protein [Suillus fuscotomentosus]|uniref:CHAT domain-containing protein n=1 Tax=Suillus fuscotomentosus TaxID=1912939 RepID=A0AAD4HHW8_9AGAM|nr:CHAT domain-containing protein [Suillus fuscotomentosus]KAG1897223.1 CHAT domain-containing protein [Suillus fuscotomentosus]